MRQLRFLYRFREIYNPLTFFSCYFPPKRVYCHHSLWQGCTSRGVSGAL